MRKRGNNARLTARLDESFGQGRAGKTGKLEELAYTPLEDYLLFNYEL